MPSLLLVGELSGTASATLEDRGYAIRRVDAGAIDADAFSGDAPDADADGIDGATPAVDADCAVVTADDGDVDAIEALGHVAPELPVLYAVPATDAGAAGTALAAGADDRVLLTGERDGSRIATRLGGLVGESARPDGAVSSAWSTDTPGPFGGAHDDRIGALLEGARDFVDADTRRAVAETAVDAAERALGYELVGVRLLDDGETLRPVASSSRVEAVLGDLPSKSLADSVVEPAIEEGRALELDDETLTAAGIAPLASALTFPLGDHGVLEFGSTRENAFGESDRRVGELLAANARDALDRIRRVERIEAIHGATRRMLDARNPEAVAQRAVDAARSIIGYRFVACYLADEETGHLEPVAWTDETDGILDGSLPTSTEGDGASEAFETGSVVRSDRVDGDVARGSPFASRLHVPIDGHGTLLVAAPSADSFDESDVQLARLLATNTAQTLDRVGRTHELERLETVFETVNDMVYVHDEDGYLLHCTPALADRLGYDRPELIGTNVSDLTDEESVAEGLDLIRELHDAPPGATRTQRLDLVTGDGEEVPVEIDVSLLPGEEYRGAVGSVRDISDLLAVRERLDSQQDRFEYLFENIPDPVVEGVIEDEEATVVSVNPAFEETFGYDEEEVVGESLNDVIVPDDELDRARALDRRAATGEINQAEVERETQYGLREFLFRGVPFASGDGPMRGFGIYTDITDQKERERHLEVLQRLLRHNVRNDVNVLLAGIDQLDVARRRERSPTSGDRSPDESTGEGSGPGTGTGEDGALHDEALLETLEETAHDLLSMSQKAKRISRVIEAEHEELGEVDVAAITRSVVERFDRRASSATIEADVPDACFVLGSGAIERALEELVGNAVQHAGTTPEIEVSLRCSEEGAELTVADDGPGVPDAERRVLEEGEITPLQHGSGLGLWLVQHATAASGGTVSFDESTGGASVTLSFRRPKNRP